MRTCDTIARRSAVPLWTPAQLANLLVWLSADKLGLSDASAVSPWNDASGVGNNASQGTSGKRPRFDLYGYGYQWMDLNPLPTVHFDATDDELDITSNSGLAPSSGLTIVAVVRQYASKSFGGFVTKWNGSNSTGWMLDAGSGGTSVRLSIGSQTAMTSTVTAIGSGLQLIEAQTDNTTGFIFQNGTQTKTLGLTTTGDSSTIALAVTTNNAATLSMQQDLSELIIVGRGLTAAERTQLRRYILARYGICAPEHAKYVAAYNGTGSSYQIGLAFSVDRRRWTKYGLNPVLARDFGHAWETDYVHGPAIIKDGAGSYKMYYAGSASGVYQICLATSSDGTTWTKSGSNPIIAFGAGGTFDAHGCYFPVAMYDPDDTDSTRRYKLWYAAVDGSGNITIGYAYSSNGTSWTKYGKVLDRGSAGTYDAKYVMPGPVIRTDATHWSMLYSGVPSSTSTGAEGDQLCLCTFSTPESTYTKSGSNPLLSPKTTAAQALTSTAAQWAEQIAVADTSAFRVGEPVCLYTVSAGGVIEMSRIRSIPDGTHLNLARPLSQQFTTGNGSAVHSMFYGSIMPRAAFVDTDGSLIVVATAWGPFANSFQRETVAFLRSASGSPSGPWDFAYDMGLGLPAEDGAAACWDSTSAENMTFCPL